MSRWRISRIRISWLTVTWITVIWVLLWGRISPANILAGVVIGVLVPALLPLPTFGYHGKVRPLGVIWLVFRFVTDLVVASFQVAFLAMNPSHHPRGAVIGVQLRTHSDLYLAWIAELSTLVPGSLVVEAMRPSGMLYVHVLDVEAMGGLDRVRGQILAVEARMLRALGSDEELEQAGVSKRRLP